MSRTIVLALALVACKSRDEAEKAAPTVPVEIARDAAPEPPVSHAWPELEDLPRAEPLRTIVVPTRPDRPRFDVGGPVIVGDLAVVSSSQLGFAAVDWKRGQLAWTKPAGGHVAPPLVRDGSVVLLGDCLTAPEVPAADLLLGCLRIVTPAGADEAYLAVHGKAADVEAFAGAPGPQAVWSDGERTLRWRRGEAAVTVDVLSGVARPAPAEAAPVVVDYKDRRWLVTQEDGKLVARQKGKVAWTTDHEVTSLVGAVWIPEQAPMIRYAMISARGDHPAIRLLDVDATGSMHGQAALAAVPGIGLLGQAISPVGDVALAIRVDKSIKRDVIAAFAANALLMWVYPLPEILRPDPVGLAIALDDDQAPAAVVAFHDGDTLTVLPPLSSPPTAPGAARAPLKNPTP